MASDAVLQENHPVAYQMLMRSNGYVLWKMCAIVKREERCRCRP